MCVIEFLRFLCVYVCRYIYTADVQNYVFITDASASERHVR